jgi:hypothetical protein
MKLQDKETLSIATAVSDVLEKKEVKEIKFPHKMYGPKGEECTAKDQEEHEEYTAKGYSHIKPVKEVDEPTAQGEKDFKAKHKIKKSGEKEDGTVVKEMLEGRMDVATVTTGASSSPDEPIRKGAKRYNVKVVKIHSGHGSYGEDLVTFKGKEKDLVKMFSNHYGFDGKDLSDLEADDDYLVGPGKIYGYTVKEMLGVDEKYRDPKLPPIPRTDHQLQIAIDIVKNRHKGMKSTRGHQSPEEAEKKLRTKYKYTDKMIAKLKEEESVEEAKSKFSKALLKKATDTALKMSGNMTGAVKEIEKMKKGLSKDKEVAAALQLANEEVSEAILVAAHEIDEATKAGKGKVKLDIDWIGDKKLAADVKKKYNVTVKPTGRTTADISGNKQDIVKMMLAPDVMGFDQDDLEDLFPELFEAVAIPADEAEQSPKQKKYQAFFRKALKKFGVKSPQELKRDKRKEFFDYVDANWEENARRVGSATAY